MPWLLVGAVAACSGQAGTPGAPTPAPGQVFVDAGPLDAEAGPPPALVQVAGTVTTPSDAGVSGAFVVVEVGGLDRANPASDGGGPTFAIDPFIRFGAVTDSMGHFSVSGVSAGMVGLHVLDPSYAETALLASTATLEGVTLNGLAVDGGGGPPPTMTGLSAPAFVSPSSEIQFAVNVAAGSADDPLSEDVFLIEPSAQWAGAHPSDPCGSRWSLSRRGLQPARALAQPTRRLYVHGDRRVPPPQEDEHPHLDRGHRQRHRHRPPSRRRPRRQRLPRLGAAGPLKILALSIF